MKRTQGMAVVIVLLIRAPASFAGDLDELPKDGPGFKAKIDAFIKPGGSAVDARKLLETHRFQCQDSKDAEGPYVWCSRLDRSSMTSVRQRYQVVIRSGGRTVTGVKTSTGLVGP